MKNIYKAASLSVTSLFILAQFGCSTPTTSTPSNTPATSGTNTTTTDTTVAVKATSLLLTQKDAKGITNPIVPEDLESVTINGKSFSVADINISKGLSTKATGALKLSYKNGRFVFEGNDDSVNLNISFKLKGGSNITLPDFNLLQLTGDTRVEFSTDDSGKVSKINFGFYKDGVLDPSQPVVTYNPTDGTLQIIKPDGNKLTYNLEDTQTELKVKSEPKTEKLTDAQKNLETKKITDDVNKISPAAGFVGKWKYNSLGSKLSLMLREVGSSSISYSSNFSNEALKFNSSFSGSVAYTADTFTSLNIDSTIAGKAVKGKVMLPSDNQLVFTITQTDVAEVQSFVNVPLTLERDVN